MRIWASFSLILVLCSAHVSAMLLDPKLISSDMGTWYCHLDKFKGEQYYEIKYQGKTIFRTLERVIPTWNRIVLQAQEESSYLYLPHIDTDVFIVDKDEFSAFRIVDMTFFDPGQVNLREHTPLARKKYYTVELVLDDCSKQSAYGRPKKISKKLFLALSKAKFKAQKQGASVGIDMHLFARRKGAKIDFDDFIRVMKKDVTN
jgi:hypothetical protein